jgi:protein arginine N-methyltransferase 5
MANASLPAPIVPTLTDEDTSLFPSAYVAALVAYVSPWIDLCSADAAIASISRQALNLEVAYANFCGVRSIIIPGPRTDSGKEAAQYARAVQETLVVATRVNIIIHMPMYREPGLEETTELLSSSVSGLNGNPPDSSKEIDVFGAWSTWHTIRTVCNYASRLFVGKFLFCFQHPKVQCFKAGACHLRAGKFAFSFHD